LIEDKLMNIIQKAESVREDENPLTRFGLAFIKR